MKRNPDGSLKSPENEPTKTGGINSKLLEEELKAFESFLNEMTKELIPSVIKLIQKDSTESEEIETIKQEVGPVIQFIKKNLIKDYSTYIDEGKDPKTIASIYLSEEYIAVTCLQRYYIGNFLKSSTQTNTQQTTPPPITSFNGETISYNSGKTPSPSSSSSAFNDPHNSEERQNVKKRKYEPSEVDSSSLTTSSSSSSQANETTIVSEIFKINLNHFAYGMLGNDIDKIIARNKCFNKDIQSIHLNMIEEIKTAFDQLINKYLQEFKEKIDDFLIKTPHLSETHWAKCIYEENTSFNDIFEEFKEYYKKIVATICSKFKNDYKEIAELIWDEYNQQEHLNPEVLNLPQNNRGSQSCSSSSSSSAPANKNLADSSFSQKKQDDYKIKEQQDNHKEEKTLEVNIEALELYNNLPAFIKILFKNIFVMSQELGKREKIYHNLKSEIEKFDWSKWLVNEKNATSSSSNKEQIENIATATIKENEIQNSFEFIQEKSFDLYQYLQKILNQGLIETYLSGGQPVYHMENLNKYLPGENAFEL